MQPQSSPEYEITSLAKVKRNLLGHHAIIAGDNKNLYILDKDTMAITFTLDYTKITKAYAQLGQLYIKHGFGKMISVDFVTLDAGNVVSSALNSTASSLYHVKQAEGAQEEIQKWLTHFEKHSIRAKQTLSPKKFAIITIVVSIIVLVYRIFNGY